MKFTIEGRLDGLNEYIRACRENKYGGNTMKQKNEYIVLLAIRQAKLKPLIKYPINLKITWYERDMRRDTDNICFAVKFIQDALVQCGILKNDSRKYVKDIEHHVKIDKEYPRIEVEIIE